MKGVIREIIRLPSIVNWKKGIFYVVGFAFAITYLNRRTFTSLVDQALLFIVAGLGFVLIASIIGGILMYWGRKIQEKEKKKNSSPEGNS